MQESFGIIPAISSSCFMSSTARAAITNGIGRMAGKVHASEVEPTFAAAEKFDVGIELAFRPGIYELLRERELRRVVQVHAPIMYDIRSLLAHPYRYNPRKLDGLREYLFSLGGMITTLGSVKNDFSEVADLTRITQSNIVMHPEGARNLKKKQNDLFIQWKDFIGYEADWPPLYNREDRNQVLTWNDEDAMRDIVELDIGANPDTSHHLISYNPPMHQIYESLSLMRQVYGTRVRGMHISAVVTDPDRAETIYDGNGALPFNSSRLPSDKPEYTDAIRRFVQDVDKIAKTDKRRIPGVVEIYGWDGIDTYEGRLRGVEATLNGLYTSVPRDIGVSFPLQPTRRV